MIILCLSSNNMSLGNLPSKLRGSIISNKDLLTFFCVSLYNSKILNWSTTSKEYIIYGNSEQN